MLTFSGTTVPAINANGLALPGSSTFNIKVITGSGSFGCSVAAFGGPLPLNTIAVVNSRRHLRARREGDLRQQAGAAAVVMVNNAPGFPPVEGPITANPDDGVPFKRDDSFPWCKRAGHRRVVGRRKAARGKAAR